MTILQFTGLSGAGKSTLALLVQQQLAAEAVQVEIIDGDTYRQTLCKDLGFSQADRMENIRRLGSVANEQAKKGKIAIIAAINPFEAVRQELKTTYNAHTVWIQCGLPTLTQRDTKGLYRRAMLPDTHPEKINNLTGVNDVYEVPAAPDLVINTEHSSAAADAAAICQYIRSLFPGAGVPTDDTMQ